MQPCFLRAQRCARPSARHLLAAVPFILVSACGILREGDTATPGGDTSTGPGAFPSVVGSYQRTDDVAAISCSPQTPPAGGDIAIDAYTLVEPVKTTQSGSKVSLSYLNFPADPADTGTIDMAGKVKMGFKLIGVRESKLRAGSRQFYVDVTGSYELDRLNNGDQLKGTGTFLDVFHEGSATAPVYATCTRTYTIDMTKTGS
jgi:hypothetical protein